MKLEQKINEIGKLVADIKLSIYLTQRKVDLIKEYIVNKDKLKFERYWRELTTKEI